MHTLRITLLFLALSMTASGCSDSNSDIIENDEGKLKVGVFGGSISVLAESEAAKDVWRARLNIKVYSCGVPGAGFSSLTANNVPMQIEKAMPFDIYILWASTNDAVRGYLGAPDYDDDRTQDGGIQKAIELIKQRNDKALILLFTSMPRFDNDTYNMRIPYFVEDQIILCKKYNIPYLELHRLCGFNKDNYKQYYLPDQVHLTREGYLKIATIQATFIREQIEIHNKSNNPQANEDEL